MSPATEMDCPGAGKAWTVDNSGKPVCPRCKRALTSVAGRNRTITNTPTVPQHTRPRSHRVDRPKS